MSPILRRDIRQLELDVERVQRGLNMLESDYAAWGNQYQQNDLKKLTENLNRLESDVSTMMSDCTFSGVNTGKITTGPSLIDFTRPLLA